MDSFFNKIKEINRIENELFQRLLRFEKINFEYRPLLKDIIRGDSNKFKKEKFNDKELEIIKDVIEFFSFNEFKNKFDRIFKDFSKYIGLSIFFMPGTDKPIPIFYGDWAQKEDDPQHEYLKDYSEYHINHFYDKDNNKGRIIDVSGKLKHLKYPLYGKIFLNKSVKRNNNEELIDEVFIDNFFFWIKSLIDLRLISGYDFSESNVFDLDKDYIKKGGNILEKGYIMEYDYDKFKKIPPYYKLKNSEHDVTIYWKRKQDWEKNKSKAPAMIYDPIYINHDTFALIVTYFIDSAPDTQNEINKNVAQIRHLHKVFSLTIFDCIYNAILRENNRILFNNLKRGIISNRLLEMCSISLGGNSKFTYKWFDFDEREVKEDKDKSREEKISDIINKKDPKSCSDLRSFIYGDYYKNPQDIFMLILDIEKFIYHPIRLDFNANNIEDFPPLPIELPNSLILKNIENTQRSLNMYDRDHMIHQFQVFLIGANIINKYYDEFAKRFKIKLVEDKEIRIEEDLLDENNVKLLIKTVWFFVSLYHDIGYPIEKIDDVFDEIKNHVSNLPNMHKSYMHKKIKINFSPLLYDDPRSYILLRQVAYTISDMFYKTTLSDPTNGDVSDPNKERWWYFIRYLTFEKKRHELMSVISLGLYFIDHRKEGINDFINSKYGKFIIKHILTPIAVHHFIKWEGEIDKILESYLSSIKEYEDYNMKQKIQLKHDFIKNNLPDFKNFKITFKDNPFAALLIFIDSVQEEGRPSGNKEHNWPERTSEVLDLENKKYTITYYYKSTSKTTIEDCGIDLGDKVIKIEDIFDKYVHISLLKNFTIIIKGDYKPIEDEPFFIIKTYKDKPLPVKEKESKITVKA